MTHALYCRLLALAITVFGVHGCGTPSATVRSSHDSAFRGLVSRLVVIIGEGNRNPGDAKQLSEYLGEALEERDIQSHIVTLGEGRKLDEAAMEKFRPDAVLTILPRLVIHAPNGDRLKVRYDASLWPEKSPNKRAWRAEIEHEGGGLFFPGRESAMPGRLKVMAARLVESLVADGMLATSRPPS